jgi:hypothetical protein
MPGVGADNNRERGTIEADIIEHSRWATFGRDEHPRGLDGLPRPTTTS